MNFKTIFLMLFILCLSVSRPLTADLDQDMQNPEYQEKLITIIEEKLHYPSGCIILGYYSHEYCKLSSIDPSEESNYDILEATIDNIRVLLAVPKSEGKRLTNSKSCKTFEGWAYPDAD